MTNKQNILVSVLVTIVAMLGIFALVKRFKPTWLSEIEEYLAYDKNGFPRLKKEGDRFILSDKTYIYKNGVWVIFTGDGGPGGGLPAERRSRMTIDQINATTKQKGGCVRHPFTLANGTSGVYYTYGGHEVSFEDCKSHNKL